MFDFNSTSIILPEELVLFLCFDLRFHILTVKLINKCCSVNKSSDGSKQQNKSTKNLWIEEHSPTVNKKMNNIKPLILAVN